MRPHRIYVLLAFSVAFLVGATGAILYLGNQTSAQFVPLINKALAIRLDLTMAHLWLEETIAGDRGENADLVWDYLDQADENLEAMLEGVPTGRLTNLPLSDPELRKELLEIRDLMEEFRRATLERLKSEDAGTGSEADQRYDALFDRLNLRIGYVDSSLRAKLQRATQRIELIEVMLIIGGVMIVAYMGRTVHVYTSRLRQAMDSLAESEATMRSIFRAAPIGIGRVIDRVFMQVNDRFCEMIGYTAEELIGQNARMIYPSQEEYKRVGRELYAEAERRGVGTIEAQWMRKDGTVVDISINLTPFDPGEGAFGLTFTALDITKQKQIEAIARQQTEIHRALFTTMTEGCAYFDAAVGADGGLEHCRFLDVNPAFESLFGVHAAALVGREMADVWPDLPPGWFERCADVVGDGAPQSFEGYHEPTGRYYHASAFKPEAEKSAFCVFYLDITDRIHTEQAIARLNAELRQHSEGLEQRIRERTAEIVDKKNSLEQALAELRTTHSQLVQSERMAFLGQILAGITHDLNTPLGAIRSARGMIASLFERVVDSADILTAWRSGEHGAAVDRVLGAIHDTRSNDEALTSREKSKARIQLAAALRDQGVEQPENAARLLVDLHLHASYAPLLPMLRQAESPALVRVLQDVNGIRRSTEIIQVAVEKAANVIFAMKSYTRRAPGGEMERVDLRENINTVLTLFANTLKKGDVELVTCLERPLHVECRRDEMSQVWTNLIQNALHAMNHKGKLIVAAKPQGEEALVLIRDFGCGIPETVRERIFDPFFTTKANGEGSGLGLDIVKRVVEHHHGRIEVKSQQGRGTTFLIYLPLRQPRQSGRPGKDDGARTVA